MNDLDRIAAGGDLGGGQGGSNARLFHMLWRGKWILILCSLLGGAAGVEYLKGYTPYWKGLTPIYRATAKLVISNREVDLIKGESGSASTKQTNLLNRQRTLVKSEAMLRRMGEREELKELRHFRSRKDEPFLGVLNQSLFASVDSRQDLLLIHFESPFKREAVTVVDAAVDAFLDFQRDKKLEETQLLIGLLDENRDAKQAEIEQLDQRIHELKKENFELFGATGDKNLVTERMDSVSQSLNAAANKVIQARSVLESLQEAQQESSERFLDYGAFFRNDKPNAAKEEKLRDIENELERAEKRLAEEMSGLAETHPNRVKQKADIVRLTEERDAILLEYANAYLTSARISMREAQREKEHWQSEYDSLEGDVIRTEEATSRLNVLLGRQATMREELREIIAGIGQLELAEETGGLNIDVLERARAGSAAVYPDPVQILGMFLAGGIGLGLAFVLIRGFLDKRIWTVEEVPDLLGLSVLSAFPRVRWRDRARIGRVVEEAQGSVAAESIRSVRTATTFALPEGRGAVLVTSCVSGEGKSVTASNLALALAQAGRRTLLVDADLRNPHQHVVFGVENASGLGDVLAGSEELGEVILSNVARHLDLLPAGDATGQAAELIEGKHFQSFFEGLKAQYECVVFDSSPVLETSETRVLANLCDATLFVLRLNVSSKPNAIRARDILQGAEAKILGVQLNGARSKKGARAYAGGIAYGYGYGYGQRDRVA